MPLRAPYSIAPPIMAFGRSPGSSGAPSPDWCSNVSTTGSRTPSGQRTSEIGPISFAMRGSLRARGPRCHALPLAAALVVIRKVCSFSGSCSSPASFLQP